MVQQPHYKVGIIGCGKMGRDLFNYLTDFSFQITLVCRTEMAAELLKSTFQKKQRRSLKFKLIDQQTFDFRQKNTTITPDLNLLKTCNLVIESINEDIHKKRALFNQLEPILNEESIIVSNTSSIHPDLLFKDCQFADRACGLHFFFPSSMKNISEINIAENTSDKTVERITDFLQQIGKFCIKLKDPNIFLINRIFLKMQAGCCMVLQEKNLGEYEIDELVKSNLFPIGVFEFFDHVGYEVMLQSVKNYVSYVTDKVFYQSLINYLESKIADGGLGIKIQKGIYEPSVDEIPLKDQNLGEKVGLLEKITKWYLDGVFEAIEKEQCSKSDLEHIVKEYMMVEKSPFELAEEKGYTAK